MYLKLLVYFYTLAKLTLKKIILTHYFTKMLSKIL